MLQLCAAGHGIKCPTLGSWPAAPNLGWDSVSISFCKSLPHLGASGISFVEQGDRLDEKVAGSKIERNTTVENLSGEPQLSPFP